jgi:glycerol kinase
MAEVKSGSMAEGPYLLGMDIGTGGVRVGIFDCKGTPVVFEGVELETRHRRPGRAEQDPETWWSGLATAFPSEGCTRFRPCSGAALGYLAGTCGSGT